MFSYIYPQSISAPVISLETVGNYELSQLRSYCAFFQIPVIGDRRKRNTHIIAICEHIKANHKPETWSEYYNRVYQVCSNGAYYEVKDVGFDVETNEFYPNPGAEPVFYNTHDYELSLEMAYAEG